MNEIRTSRGVADGSAACGDAGAAPRRSRINAAEVVEPTRLARVIIRVLLLTSSEVSAEAKAKIATPLARPLPGEGKETAWRERRQWL
jgi:hypothetical protein